MDNNIRYNEPWILQRADPYVCRHTDGFYYFTASLPEYDGIALRRSRTLQGLSDAEEIRVCGNGEQDIRKKQSSGIAEVQILAAGCRDEKELEQLADKLSEYDVVISSETGCGVVPADPAAREAREKAGRLNCLLAARASKVVRVFCGIPQVIKR